jgi:putative ABC transport system permease protein
VMGIPILAGRAFESGESAPVTLISEVLAEEHFPGEDPLGRTLTIIGQDHVVIGVVGSTAHFGPDAPEPTAMYVSYEAVNWDFAHVVAQGDPSVGPRIAEAVRLVAPGANEPAVAPYETHLANWFRPLRIQLGIVGALGLVGAVLAALGLYANIAYHVRWQLPELGIRVALGASRGRILSGVVRRGLTASAAGLAIGLGLWWAGRNRLGEVLGAPDAVLSPFALATTSALILGLTLVAVALPGLRASRVDPLESLQVD